MDWQQHTALGLAALLRSRQLGCAELARLALDATRAANPALNACTALMETQAMAAAHAAQALLDAGDAPSPLTGVPFLIKDNICTQGVQTSCGSRMLAGFCPPYSATAYQRLLAAGLVPIAKTNMDEFAMGGSTETSFYGPAKNPWDKTRVPGGSSGGSAAGVAAGLAPLALGSDTGGSIRQPAAFCGVTGLKPGYGAVSRHGLIAYASSLDQIGPIARDARDCAALLALMAGRDPLDATSMDIGFPAPDANGAPTTDLKGLRIGLPKSYFGPGLQPQVAALVQKAAQALAAQGAMLVHIDLPLLDYAVPAYYIIACAEASSNLSCYDGIRYGYNPFAQDAAETQAAVIGSNGKPAPAPALAAHTLEEQYRQARSQGFGAEAKRRMLLGAFVLSAGYFDAYYKKAMQARSLIRHDFEKAFAACDLILGPTAPTPAYKLGAHSANPLEMYLGDIYTVSVNLAGLPAAALPCGFAQEEDTILPVGMQLIGPPKGEASILRAAVAYQQVTNHHLHRPPPMSEQACTSGTPHKNIQADVAPAASASPAAGKTAAPVPSTKEVQP